VGKDVAANVLFVAQGGENHWLQSRRLHADRPSWVAGAAPAETFRCTARTRYRQTDQDCVVTLAAGGIDVHFDQAQRAVTPGQSVVLYAGAVCLGGAVITATDAAFGGLASVAPPASFTSLAGDPPYRV
jgi:tRNA-specific 2-thiouridylase